MWYRVVMFSGLIGRILTVFILTKFNYLEAAGGLALLFTTSTLFNNALPPLHKDIYIKAVKTKVYNKLLLPPFLNFNLFIIYSMHINKKFFRSI